MNCLIINPDGKLDAIVQLANQEVRLKVIELKKDVNIYLSSASFYDNYPGIVFVHLDTIMSIGNYFSPAILDKAIYTTLITHHLDKPIEADFLWQKNVYYFDEAIREFPDTIDTAFKYHKKRKVKKAKRKYKLFFLDLFKEGTSVRVLREEITAIRRGSVFTYFSVDSGHSYLTGFELRQFDDITNLKEFMYVAEDVIINILKVDVFSGNQLQLQNGEQITLEDQFLRAYVKRTGFKRFNTLKLPVKFLNN